MRSRATACLDRVDRRQPPDQQRDGHVREHDDVAQRQQRQAVAELERLVAALHAQQRSRGRARRPTAFGRASGRRLHGPGGTGPSRASTMHGVAGRRCMRHRGASGFLAALLALAAVRQQRRRAADRCTRGRSCSRSTSARDGMSYITSSIASSITARRPRAPVPRLIASCGDRAQARPR